MYNHLKFKNVVAERNILLTFEVQLKHGDIMLNTSNNSKICIETSAPQEAGSFVIKRYFGISNIAACIWKTFPIGSLSNNQCPIMFDHGKACFSYWFSHSN